MRCNYKCNVDLFSCENGHRFPAMQFCNCYKNGSPKPVIALTGIAGTVNAEKGPETPRKQMVLDSRTGITDDNGYSQEFGLRLHGSVVGTPGSA